MPARPPALWRLRLRRPVAGLGDVRRQPDRPAGRRHDKLVRFHAAPLQCQRQVIDGIFESVGAQLEHLEMGGDAQRRAQIQVRLDGLGRSHVDDGRMGRGIVRLSRPERRDRQDRRPDWRKAAGDLSEMGAVPRVPGKKDVSRWPGYDKTSPEGLVAVPQYACRKVLRRNQRDRHLRRETDRLPPVALLHCGDARAANEIEIAQRYNRARDALFRETTQRRKIQVVIMVVGDQHDVNRRQLLKANARVLTPPGAGPGDRAAPFGPDGVGQDVEAVHLDQKRRVADRGHHKLSLPDPGRRRGSGQKIPDLRPFGPVVSENEPPDPRGAAASRCLTWEGLGNPGIEVVAAVEVVRYRERIFGGGARLCPVQGERREGDQKQEDRE